MPRHCGSHDSDRPGASDQHVLTKHRKRKRGVNRVAEWIKDRGDFKIHFRIVPPDVRHRQHNILGKCARSIYSHSLGMRAKMAAPGEAVTTSSASYVSLAAD